ncbi:MAG: hypothetical protein ACREQR_15855 [Candidatus Binataceae bacterium]
MLNSNALITFAVLFLQVATIACAAPAAAGAKDLKPPADLVKLEREVSLKIAHARGEGPTDPGKRRQLSDAEQLDAKAENEIGAGDFRVAEDDLVKANALATELLH